MVQTEERIAVELRASAVVIKGNAILLVQHTRDRRSYWVLPGGHPHAGEVVSAAAEREVLEETGLRVEPGSVLFVWEGIAPRGGRRIVEVVFRAELRRGDTEVRSARADEQPAFVAFEELHALPMYPPIAGYLRGADLADGDRGARYLGNLWRSMSGLESTTPRRATARST